MSDVLARLEQANLKGISPSLPHQQGRIWKDGENVIFHEESIQPVPGQSALFLKPASTVVLGLLERENSSGVKELFFGNPTNLFSWTATGGVLTEASGFTLAALATSSRRQQFWSQMVWDNWVMATNGKDAPQIRTTATGFRPTTASDRDFTYAEIFATLGEYALAIGTSNGGKVVQWSDTDLPESFIESDLSNAGRMHIRELENNIIAAATLGPGLALYSSDSMSLLQHIGGDLIFTRRPLISGLGVVGKQAVCSVGGQNYGLSYRGLWETDGNSFTHLDDPEIHDELFDNINLNQISKAVAWYDKLLNSVVFFVPSANSDYNDRAIVFNRSSRLFTKFGFGRSFAVETGVFPYGITGDENGNVYAQSVIGAPAGSGSAPVVTTATAVIEAGFGELGFGELGFGGAWSGNG